jgi:cytochrome c
MKQKYVYLAAIAAWAGSGAAALAADPAEGEKVFNQKCKVCHQVGEGAKNFVGPELNGLIGRKAGSAPDYSYSEAMKSSGITWSEDSLKQYLIDPKKMVPGTKMVFAGLPKEGDRENLAAYLAQFDASGKKK